MVEDTKLEKATKTIINKSQNSLPASENQAAGQAKRTEKTTVKSGKKRDEKSVKSKNEIATEKVKRTALSRLNSRYLKEVRPFLVKELNLKNIMEAPKIVKISINMGLGESGTNPKLLDTAIEDLTALTGQKPVITKSAKAIAAFKLKAGQKVGAMVTLRRDAMYEFLDRLVTFALPRVRDFKGVSPKGFDGRGNYTLGIREGSIFPEAGIDRIEKPKGMNITIATTAKTDEHGKSLLRHLGMPFRS